MGVGKSSHEGAVRSPSEKSKDSQGRTPAERDLDKARADSKSSSKGKK